ncbi:MAG: hypothetical protein LBE24_08895 [Methylobacillus sp.]|jgi:phage repressor protein C with HTH and peptisase S24 domain|nr:hypothetical protein [Methylobacillus sp.]
MAGIREKLLELIGNNSINGWASRHELPHQTVHGWIKNDRMPHTATLERLSKATGKSVAWWRSEGDDSSDSRVNGVQNQVAQPPAGYISIPLYSGVRAAAGNGAVIEHEVPDDALVFKDEWIRHEIGAQPQDLYLIRVAGDSMEPTLRAGDVILIDRRATRPDREGVYILRMNDMLLVKRLQALPNGVVRVISDNSAFTTFDIKVSEIDGSEMAIIGRVVWTGRRM